MRLKALVEIYTMHSFAQLCNLNFSSSRGYLGLFSFSFFFEKDWTTLLACLLASIHPGTNLSKFVQFSSYRIQFSHRNPVELGGGAVALEAAADARVVPRELLAVALNLGCSILFISKVTTGERLGGHFLGNQPTCLFPFSSSLFVQSLRIPDFFKEIHGLPTSITPLCPGCAQGTKPGFGVFPPAPHQKKNFPNLE